MRTWISTRAALCASLALLGCGSVTGSDRPPSRCPSGPYGGSMVEVPAPDGGAYCIDSHEVTTAQYAGYLATDPPPITLFDCNQVSAEPANWDEFGGDPSMPVRQVSWCKADAFCRANAKRLCGRIGGGPLDGMDDSANDATQSEWFNACTAGGTRSYPYGAAYEEGRCADGKTEIVPAGSMTRCEGGFEGIFDMNGNVSEHENGCQYTPRSPGGGEWEDEYYCLRRGELAAGYHTGCIAQREASSASAAGIRCCADVTE